MKLTKKIMILIMAAVLILGVSACDKNGDKPPVNLDEYIFKIENGKITKNGKNYYGIGLNYYNFFNVGFKNAFSPEVGNNGLQVLKDKGVPYVRFNAGGFGYKDFDYYKLKNDKFFELLDANVKKAEELGVGLIPSFFWLFAAVPDLHDEPFGEWGNAESKTRKFMREYTTEIVERYKDSPAIWGWEFGNEYTNYCDLPNATTGLLQQHALPQNSSRQNRDSRDILKSEHFNSAFKEWAETIQSIDKSGRLIMTGGSHLRASAYNQKKSNTWDKDTREQQVEMAKLYNPDPIATFTEHMYTEKDPSLLAETAENTPAGEKYYGIDYTSWGDYLDDRLSIAEEIKKPFILGEFGYTYPEAPFPTLAVKKAKTHYIFNLIAEKGIQMAMYWNYDPKAQLPVDGETNANDRSAGVEWSFNEGSFKDYIFDMIKEANIKLSNIK